MNKHQIKIDKDIPMPKRGTSYRKYPFADMKIGDSFLVSETYTRSLSASVLGAANYWKKKYSMAFMFSCRKTIDNKLRVWRIK